MENSFYTVFYTVFIQFLPYLWTKVCKSGLGFRKNPQTKVENIKETEKDDPVVSFKEIEN